MQPTPPNSKWRIVGRNGGLRAGLVMTHPDCPAQGLACLQHTWAGCAEEVALTQSLQPKVRTKNGHTRAQAGIFGAHPRLEA
eukprot:267073-Amphidinium_carterae.2